jgi:RNA polymerase sigma-70 factor (subfamily 1)
LPDLAREESFASYLNYLNTLQSIQVSPRLRRKFTHSDLVQKTLLEAVADYDALEALSESARRARLYRMLLNNLRDEVDRYAAACRDVGREQPLQAEAARSSLRLDQWLRCDRPDPPAEAIFNEERQRLLEALAGLSPLQREGIILKELHGWPLAEIAEHQGRTIGAVAGDIYRGLKEIRVELPGTD